jgi:hypothetical protein
LLPDLRCIFWPIRQLGSGGKNPKITLEQVADAANMLAWKIWQKYPHSWKQKVYVCEYYQERNEASYASRKKMAKAKNIEFL